MVLDKLKVIAALGLAIQILRVFFPGLDFGEEFEGSAKALVEALYVIVPIVIGWFVPETVASIDRLVPRGVGSTSNR